MGACLCKCLEKDDRDHFEESENRSFEKACAKISKCFSLNCHDICTVLLISKENDSHTVHLESRQTIATSTPASAPPPHTIQEIECSEVKHVELLEHDCEAWLGRNTCMGNEQERDAENYSRRHIFFSRLAQFLCMLGAIFVAGQVRTTASRSRDGQSRNEVVELESYVVCANESFRSIAKDRKTSVLKLLDLNPRAVASDDGIQEGTYIVVPKVPQPNDERMMLG